jgi:hypothetical protein
MKGVAVLTAAGVVMLAGCGSQAMLNPKRLPQVVLQPSDLPGWTRFQSDPGTEADAGELGSRDRTGDWIARYRRAASIVVSRVDIYENAGAAHDVFKQLQDTNGALPLRVPALGSERVGYSVGSTTPTSVVFWRRANAIGSVVVQGVGPAAVALAAREDGRIRKAIG